MLLAMCSSPSIPQPEKPVLPPHVESARISTPVIMAGAESVQVPVLMYHHFAQEPASDVEISPEVFAQHLEALSQAGYTAVLVRDLIDFVYDGGSLPEKPVCITIDDGYLSNYEIAWPLLEQYGMKATIFVIGSSIGSTDFYKDTEYPITPHFNWDQAREMQASGTIDIQCHTYDMHQWPVYESGDKVRASILRLDGESEADYRAAVTEDLTSYDQLRSQEMGEGFSALAYPGGGFDELSEEIVHELGIPVTLTTQALGPNTVTRWDPASLYAMYRWNISSEVTGEQLLEMIQ